MMEAGAMGYLLKNVNKAELLAAIRAVFSGNKYFNSDLTLSLLNRPEVPKESSTLIFSERESEILKLIVDGFSSTEIGKKLFISSRTVETHRANMMNKLEVKNVAGLIREAIRRGIA